MGSEMCIRDRSNMVMPVDSAAIVLPAMNTIMMASNSVLRDMVDVSEVRTGAPKVTPNAYKVTVSPAVVTEMPRSSAMRGRSPTLINSVVPMANALMASASSAHVLRFESCNISCSTPPNVDLRTGKCYYELFSID